MVEEKSEKKQISGSDSNIPKQRFELVEVPTEHVVAIRDSNDDSLWDMNKAIMEILNKLDKIERAIG